MIGIWSSVSFHKLCLRNYSISYIKQNIQNWTKKKTIFIRHYSNHIEKKISTFCYYVRKCYKLENSRRTKENHTNDFVLLHKLIELNKQVSCSNIVFYGANLKENTFIVIYKLLLFNITHIVCHLWHNSIELAIIIG